DRTDPQLTNRAILTRRARGVTVAPLTLQPLRWLALFTQNEVSQRTSHDREGRSTGQGRDGAPDRTGASPGRRRGATGASLTLQPLRVARPFHSEQGAAKGEP